MLAPLGVRALASLLARRVQARTTMVLEAAEASEPAAPRATHHVPAEDVGSSDEAK